MTALTMVKDMNMDTMRTTAMISTMLNLCFFMLITPLAARLDRRAFPLYNIGIRRPERRYGKRTPAIVPYFSPIHKPKFRAAEERCFL